MKVGVIGLPQTGKKTLFQILTGSEVKEQSGPPKPLPGTADILDTRFDKMVAMYSPKKEVRARVDLVLLPKMEQENISKGDIFRDIADMDAVCHVVRAFEDDAIYHASGSVDPLRDASMVNAELIMHDQIFVEKRIERIEQLIKKKKDEDQQKELVLMKKMLEHLEQEKPLRLLELVPEEERLIRSYPFITRKEMIIAINVAEDDLSIDNIHPLLEKFQDMCESDKMAVMVVSAKVESEIALLESDEEKAEFLATLGIKESALEVLTRLCLNALGLISFLTVGADEVRQWLVRRGSPAPVAAGVIHSDLQRGFIRAEVIKYDELLEYGSEAELKKAGKFYVEGKEYIVQDGDILNIRFKV
ncbi:MAG: redox-regulated ATPase YchF [Desulfamplus sp.]|nr:redox-regulated ATPase YchF [Desulfamplus sp.]MBF0413569.1 redox-regulated ATPase YchF [Desulfamplus sp.]